MKPETLKTLAMEAHDELTRDNSGRIARSWRDEARRNQADLRTAHRLIVFLGAAIYGATLWAVALICG